MSRKTFGTLGITLLALLALPGHGQASILDWIWTMSGPQMWGVVLHCEYDLEHTKDTPTADKDGRKITAFECRALDRLIERTGRLKPRPERRVWLSLDSGVYTSTGYNSETADFEAWKHYMIALEPMVEIRSFTSGESNFMLHHGLIGATYNVIMGSGYRPFDKIGYKFRPVGVTINRSINASATVRFYPRGFTVDEFGVTDPRLNDINRQGEFVYGFSVGFLWGPK